MPLLPAHTLLQAYSITLALSAYLLLTSPLTLLSANPLWLLGESMHIRPAAFTPADTSTTSAGGITLKQTTKAATSLFSTDTLPNATRELLAFIAVILVIAAITQSILSTPLRYSSTELNQLAKQSTNPSRPTAHREQDTSAFAEKMYNLHTSQTTFLTLSGIRVLLEGGLVAFIYLAYSDRSPRTSSKTAAGTLADGIPGSSTSAFSLLANRILFTAIMADMLFWGYLWTVIRDEAQDLANILGQRRKWAEENEE